MQQELLDFLRPVTDEELELLQHGGEVRRERYAADDAFTIDSKRMLAADKLIDMRTHTRFVAFPKHRHNYIEMMYMCEGSTTHIVNDKDRILLQKGELLFFNQHCYHEILSADKDDIGVNFMVLPEFFHTAFDMMDEENVLSNFIIGALTRDTTDATYLHFAVSDVLPVQNLVENMIWLLLHGDGSEERLSRLTMGLLFLQLLGHTEKISCPVPEQRGGMLALTALRYIDQHFRTGSLGELAEKTELSLSTLSRLIKENTGSTFSELLQMKRFEKAVDLICNTKLNLSDIIAAVGYENTSYFYRTFKKKYRVSPREYRLRSAKPPRKSVYWVQQRKGGSTNGR